MESLLPLVRSYLESAGFRTLEQRGECVVADKLIFGQERDTWAVWTVPPDQSPRQYEPRLLTNIETLRGNYPDAKGYVLARSLAGFSRDFRQTLTESRIKLVVPIWFFDAPFKVEEAPRAASAIADVRSLASSQRRVPQPFRLEGATNDQQGEDLFETLRHELNAPSGATVRVIVGRAGMGKSFLFRALFNGLYEDFLDSKAQQRTRPRPIPLLPEHLKGTYALRTEALIDNFLRTDVAAPVSRETFEWLLVNGFATWLLDGLDELYAGDPAFFEYLFDLVASSNSNAQVTIWCRDSLLTTSDAFDEFRDVCRGSTALKIYRLSEWQRPSKRHFAWLRIEGRPPRVGAQDGERVASFLHEIDQSATLRTLTGLPFYCEVLIQQHEAGSLRSFSDDAGLLNHVIDQMVHREMDKGLLDDRYFETDGLNEWLEQIALDYVEGQRYAEIDINQASEWGELVLRSNVDDNTKHHHLTSLLQFPLFQAGKETGRIAFTHDLFAEALAARAYLRLLKKQPLQVGRRLSNVDLDDPTLLRFMASRLDAEHETAAIDEMRRGNLQSAGGYAAILTLLMLARPERDLIKRGGLSLEGQNLAAVRFDKRDLSSVSFRQADLSRAVLSHCDLREARFEGAYMNQTRFEGSNELHNAHFGDLERIESVWVGKKLLEDPAEIRRWVANATGRPEAPGEPCPTALQILHLFRKFITPLGQPRRDDLKRGGLLAGKRYGGAAGVEACLDETVRSGYLTGPDFRDRFRRAEGDKYPEMVALVRDGRISNGIGRLIAALCPRRGCTHQVRL